MVPEGQIECDYEHGWWKVDYSTTSINQFIVKGGTVYCNSELWAAGRNHQTSIRNE